MTAPTDATPVVVPGTSTWAHGDLQVALAVPQPPFAGSGPLPLVVMLDGRTMFLTAAEFTRTVTLVTMGALPPMAVVGVWRRSADPLDYVSTRFRDFTPFEWVLPDPFADDNAMVRHGTGGAAGLLRELVDDVLPAVRAQVDVDPARTAIAGWSLSGLFAAWAWRERPDVFPHLLAMSPSLWWCGARMLQEEVPARPAGSRAFISAGEREEGDMSLVWPQVFAVPAQREAAGMVRNAVAFGRQCAAAGADTSTRVLDDEHHVSLVPASLSYGLRHLFAGA